MQWRNNIRSFRGKVINHNQVYLPRKHNSSLLWYLILKVTTVKQRLVLRANQTHSLQWSINTNKIPYNCRQLQVPEAQQIAQFHCFCHLQLPCTLSMGRRALQKTRWQRLHCSYTFCKHTVSFLFLPKPIASIFMHLTSVEVKRKFICFVKRLVKRGEFMWSFGSERHYGPKDNGDFCQQKSLLTSNSLQKWV